MLARYWAFQTPGILLFAIAAILVRQWLDLPAWMALLAVALYVGLDIVLFPYVKLAYEPRSGGGADSLVGAAGTAQERLDPEGYVRVGSELWRAELCEPGPPIEAGSPVRVRQVRGLTLRVEPDGGGPEEGR